MPAIGNYSAVRGIIANPYTVYKIEMDAPTGIILAWDSFDPRDNDGSVAFASRYI